jgi:acyl-CoA reductase-like NAD-dependent aldehyde dehydrogenase
MMNNSLSNANLPEIIGVIVIVYLVYAAVVVVIGFLTKLFQSSPKSITVSIEKEELFDKLVDYPKFDPTLLNNAKDTVYYWDPSTYDYFGSTPAMSKDHVQEIVKRSRAAQAVWKNSSFAKRKELLRIMLRYITEHQEICARVAVRDSGKTMLDALIGEVLVTCEKLAWLVDHGEKYLTPEYRDTGRLMMMKTARVEYIPLGVIGAIVPWNYPFHNVFNPVSAALFSGNSIVIKVSEYASWSIGYYKRIIDACLEAIGAPKDLVQFVVGYGATGDALVRSDIDKMIFVGSPGVGSIVAKAAAETLTPVVLELGGKDPFIVCDDVNVKDIIQVACRGVWQNMGQNCAGPERFFVYEKVYEEFIAGVLKVVQKMQFVDDCGSICMGPKQLLHYQRLVDDAVSKGARLVFGGKIPTDTKGCFYPPTVLADVPQNAIIAQEEIFGPIMCIFKVDKNDDALAIAMANNCEFALSSCCFSNDAARAKRIGSQVRAGMFAANDLEGCTYMNQSLPFGGLKKSGYDRFAGPEGLRGLCSIKSICEDRISFIRNSIPPAMHYPSTGVGPYFAQGLIKMFYSTTWSGNISGLLQVIKYSIITSEKKPKAKHD